MKAIDFGYVVKNNVCLFHKGPLSQWWGAFDNQRGGFQMKGWEFPFYNNKTNVLDYVRTTYKDVPIKFNCCEQWMMANKASLFDDVDTFKLIMAELKPVNQKSLGKKVKNFDPLYWDENKFDIVLEGNCNKFENNLELEVFLKSFHPFTIFAESVGFDKVWGTGLDISHPDALDIYKWPGENLLGKIIMKIREYLENH